MSPRSLTILPAVAGIALALTTGTASAAVRHVAPDGSGSGDCLTTPCTLPHATYMAADDDTVLVAPGDYVVNQLSDVPKAGVTIQGAPGPRPRLRYTSGDASRAILSSNYRLSVRHLEIDMTGEQAIGVQADGGLVKDVVVHTTSPGSTGFAFVDGGTLKDSVYTGPGTGVAVLQGDVSVLHSTLWGRIGASVKFGPRHPAHLLITDTILHGSEHDATLQQGADVFELVSLGSSHSNYRPDSVQKSGALSFVQGDPSDQAALPRLVDPEGGDVHQLADSPTIDAASDPTGIDTDGQQRPIGAAADIGADEFSHATPSPPEGPAQSSAGRPAAPRPQLGSLRLAPHRFRPRRHGHKGGTVISWRDTTAASTSLTLQRRVVTRRHGRRIVRFVKIKGALSHRDRAGLNRLAFSGRVGRRALRPGTYRLVAVARDSRGQASAPRRAAFSVAR